MMKKLLLSFFLLTSPLLATNIRDVNIKASDSPSIDAFGRWRVSNPTTLFESKQIHDNAPLFWDDSQVSGTGTTSVHSALTASTILSVSASTAGKRIRQTFMSFNYQAGKSQLIFMTGTLGAVGGGTGIKRSMGLYDDNNGIFFRDNEGVLEAVIRSSTSGSAVENAVVQSSWNIDAMDGTGPSGLTIDGTKSQISCTDIEWLGVGRCRLGFVIGGAIIYVHQFNQSNIGSGVYMSTPNLPLRYEIENTGTGIASELEQICSTVISEGGSEDLGVVRSACTNGTHVDASTENIVYAVLGIRLKSGHIGDAVKLLTTELQEQAGSKLYSWAIMLNPTVAGTFTYVDETDSAIQIARGATANTVTGGYRVAGGFGSSDKAGGISGSSLNTSILLGADIAGTVDEMVLVVRPVGGSSNIDVEGTLTWRRSS